MRGWYLAILACLHSYKAIRAITNKPCLDFREIVAPCMRITTRGLSRHSTKTSKQSPSITLSLTNIFLNNTNDYLIIIN